MWTTLCIPEDQVVVPVVVYLTGLWVYSECREGSSSEDKDDPGCFVGRSWSGLCRRMSLPETLVRGRGKGVCVRGCWWSNDVRPRRRVLSSREKRD